MSCSSPISARLADPLPGKPVPRIDDEHQLVLIEPQALHLGMAHRPREPELHLLLQGHLQDLLGMPGPDRDGDPRISRREPLQQPGQCVGPNPRRSPDPQPPPRSPPQLLQPPLALLEPIHDPLRVRQKLLPSLRKPHPPTRPHEKRIPNLLLQRLQPRRQRRLRQKHLLGSPAQVPQPRHREETLELPEQHAVSFQSPGFRFSTASGLVATPETNNGSAVCLSSSATRRTLVHSPAPLMPVA